MCHQNHCKPGQDNGTVPARGTADFPCPVFLPPSAASPSIQANIKMRKQSCNFLILRDACRQMHDGWPQFWRASLICALTAECCGAR
eukprot:1158710-Pelagomonas_calceolata.AAC.3